MLCLYRWDWYDPYQPPADYRLMLEAGKGEQPQEQPGVDYLWGDTAAANMMKEIEKEYFSELGFTMAGTQMRPDMHNIQSHARASKLAYTTWQLVGQLKIVLSCCLTNCLAGFLLLVCR